MSAEQRAPTSYDFAVCSDCRGKIKSDDPRVSRGTGWLCQRCAYEAERRKVQRGAKE